MLSIGIKLRKKVHEGGEGRSVHSPSADMCPGTEAKVKWGETLGMELDVDESA